MRLSALRIRPLLLAGVLICAGSCLQVVRAGTKAGAPNLNRQHATQTSDAKTYAERVAGGYQMKFGADKPFLPSNAETHSGSFMDPKNFPTAEYCEHCHEESYHQWRQSAHANSFRTPWYIKNVTLLKTEGGVAKQRHCEGCHNPIALVSGALTAGGPKEFSHARSFDNDGVSCMVCHSIEKVTTRGTGSYVMGVPAVLLDDKGNPIPGKVSDAEILAHLDRHSAAVMKPFYKTSEFCSSCHKAALPRIINDYKWQRAFTVYDEWQNSSFSQQSPLPFYKKPVVSTCQSCHMMREAVLTRDEGAKDGMLVSHRWLGANTIIPKYYGFNEQSARTIQYLRNNNLNIDIFALHRTGATNDDEGQLIAPLGEQNFTISPGEPLTASVVIQNKGIGHSLVPEQRDMYEAWVKFTLSDSHGKIVSESGAVRPDGYLDPSAHSFTNRLISKTGTLNDLHQVWNTRVVAYNNTIQSGRSQVVRYRMKIPANVTGPLKLTASVEYRRFDQKFADFGIGKHYVMPIVEMASTERTLLVGENTAASSKASAGSKENPLWQRWNNYGIGLLDAQQYAASVAAFEQVVKLRPDYADAYTNVGIVDIQWQKFEDARTNIEQSLKIAANNPRALYYLALVERNEGNLDAAITDFAKVTEKFPRSRDAHRELGFSYYQQHKYTLAEAEYKQVQSIDPDDLAAHYNLSLIYRRLGDKQQAAVEGAYFADQKNDPTASTAALDFLQKHPEISDESVPWHAHSLEEAGMSGGLKPAPGLRAARTAPAAPPGER